ncbi:FAD-dependent oxidoreductase [Ideonella sp. 4Y16]|uniref:FAD-dependent oxidoreductase n=1 Tax=Ideonella alba TaxID=2824118 RepID=UPI001B36ACEC|nr:FAD-dependent oxidoreductase [Ideonella alba]MBQ0944692.1 FAD-dependent oxidoreductase [Ideonella alba]
MHQPDTTPRRSIYYDYRVHPAWTPPSLGSPPARVVVVGAGPIGMALALDLARHGVPVLLLEAQQQVSEGSRAIVFTRRSMEILQQVGADRAITAAGLPWRSGNSFFRGQRVFRMEAPHDDNDRFHPMINLQQPYLEEALLDQIAAQPLVEMRWGQKVTRILRNEDGVGARLEVDTPGGVYEQDAEWVVACDGARSELRQMCGLRMEGASYEGRFVIADIRVDLPLPTERLAFFDPPWNPGNTVLMHREPHGIWRIDYQLPADETPEQALSPESLKARIDAQLAMIGHAGTSWEMDWCSVYSARAMTLPDYRHHRLLFCGDAAHMLPIFGVRGANTGWQDAHDLGWKLAFVLKGLSGPALLDSYSHERVAAAREIIDEASKSTRFMTPPSRGFRLLRDAVLSLSLSQPFVGPLFHWRTSRPHDYADSPLNSHDDDDALFQTGPRDGAPMPNVRLGPDEHLMDHFGPAFWLLHFHREGGVPPALQAEAQRWRERGVPLQIVAVRSGGGAAEGADRVIDDRAGQVHGRYGVRQSGSCYLLRPDQHVCARWLSLDARRLERALCRATAR